MSALIAPLGRPAQAWAAWRRGEFDLVTSDALIDIDEVEDVLARPRIRRRLQPESAGQLVSDLRQSAILATPIDIADLPIYCRDQDDDHVLACAFGGDVDVIGTGDEDLLVLDGDERLGKLRIMRVADFS